MPTLVTARYDPDPKAKHSQFVAVGKPVYIAVTPVMRKLLVTATLTQG